MSGFYRTYSPYSAPYSIYRPYNRSQHHYLNPLFFWRHPVCDLQLNQSIVAVGHVTYFVLMIKMLIASQSKSVDWSKVLNEGPQVGGPPCNYISS